MDLHPVSILLLEDDDDANLVATRLRDGGFEPLITLVQTESEFVEALRGGGFDIVLADYSLLRFNGIPAVRRTREIAPELPLIIISETIGEELAIECFDNGASDYVLKHRMSRLVPAVRRALLEHAERKARSDSQEALRTSVELHAAILDALPATIVLLDPNGVIVSANKAWKNFALANDLRMKNFAIGTNYLEVCNNVAGDDRETAVMVSNGIRKVLSGALERFECEYECSSPYERRWFQFVITPLTSDRSGNAVVMHVNITERKLAEKALRQSEQRFRRLVENAAEGFFLHDLDGRFIDVNDHACQSLGYAREEIVGMRVKDIELMYSDDIHPVIWRHMSSETPVTLEGVHRRKDGSTFPVEVRLTLFAADDRDLVLGLVRDITERKRADERMKTMVSILSTTLESTADGIMVTDLEGNIVTFNMKMVEMWSLPEQAWRLNDPVTLVTLVTQIMAQMKNPEEFRDRLLEIYNHRDADIHDIVECADGRIIERYSQPHRIDGQSVGRVWSLRDITERRRNEEALISANALMNAIVEATDDPIFARDRQGRYLMANSASAALLGHTPGEIIGRNIYEVTPPALAEKYLAEDAAIIGTGQTITYERTTSPDQGQRTLLVTKCPLRDHEGEIAGVVGIAHDITDRKESEEMLRVLSKHLVEAHEIERRRLALELHDGVNQILSAAKFKVQSAEFKLASNDPRAGNDIAQAKLLLEQSIAEIRSISTNLRPSVLDDLGLVSALQSIAREFSDRTGIVVGLQLQELPERLSREVELTFFRIVQEALHNIEQHANASNAWIMLTPEERLIAVTVVDDGIGFDKRVVDRKIRKEPHFGIVGMRERAAFVQGVCEIESSIGKGTRIRVALPLQENLLRKSPLEESRSPTKTSKD